MPGGGVSGVEASVEGCCVTVILRSGEDLTIGRRLLYRQSKSPLKSTDFGISSDSHSMQVWASPATWDMAGRAVVLRIEPPAASRP